jgi:hypothetical protein
MEKLKVNLQGIEFRKRFKLLFTTLVPLILLNLIALTLGRNTFKETITFVSTKTYNTESFTN